MFDNTDSDDSDTDDRLFNQPQNDSLPARLARKPLLNRLPGVPDESDDRTQELVSLNYPFRGDPALVDESGALIGGVKIEPANMALADIGTWEKRVRSLADTLATTVSYEAQWYSPMRTVNYDDRQERYKDAELTVRRQQDDLSFAEQVRADVWEERAAVVDLYQQTTLSREYYMLAKVRPGEGVLDTTSEEGGLGNVPGLGELIEKKELHERAGSADLTNQLLDTLRRRVEELATALGQIEGLSAHPVGSFDLAQVAADYYRADNVGARDEWTTALRGAPTPGTLEDPEHEMTYQHVTALNNDEGRQPIEPDGGAVQRPARGRSRRSPSVPDADTPGEVGDWEFDTAAVNANAVADLVSGEEATAEHFRSVLAPEVFDRSNPDYVQIDDDLYSTTLALREWPGQPAYGALENVLNYGLPGVEVVVSTSIEGVDEQKARRELADAQDALTKKAEDALNSKWNPFGSKYERKLSEVSATLDALEASDYGLFDTQTYITVRAPDTDTLQTAISQIRARLQDERVSAKRMKFNHEAGYRMSAPTVPKSAYQPVKMLGMGLASLFPWSTQNVEEPGGIEIGEHAHTGEPTILDWYDCQTGYNFGIYGNIGSGKTTTGKQIAFRQKTKHPDMKLVMVDPLQEFTGLCEAFDGQHIIVGGDTPINPMRIEPTPTDRLQKIGKHTPYNDAVTQTIGFVGNYYYIEGLSGFEEKKGTWQKAIKAAYKRAGITKDPTTHSNASPTLADVIDVLKAMVTDPETYVDKEIRESDEAVNDRQQTAIDIVNNDIEAFNDEYGQLTKQSNISFDDADTIYLDLQRYENEQQRGGLMMELLLKEMYEQAKTSPEPLMMLIDEASYMLKNSANLESLKQAHRHSRHYDLSIGLFTQSVSEFFAETSGDGSNQTETLTESAEVIFQNQSRQIYHYLKEMNDERGREIGLSEQAVEYIQDADPGEAGKGWSDALLDIDQKESYPLRVVMTDEMNPREFALYEYDAANDGSDLQGFLEDYCAESDEQWEWRWS
ncbi:hypothetical protein [Haladaptatus sp. DYF46]|uniref:VirB4 family type IV secretion system protein n=1 Tax=Haladaptatus sp. DYF46 TaxID=2886041 RepID=UPI001E2F2812|nr:hypothetical protein [Haladaptatus sp. DYF46]